MDEIDKKEVMLEKLKHMASESRYKFAFLFLVFFLVGFSTGIYFAKEVVIAKYLKDATTIGGIVINNVPYDLKGR